MNFTVNFTANEVFDAKDEVAVESFCQVLGRVGQDYLRSNVRSFAPEKPSLTKEEIKLNEAKAKEIEKMLWSAQGEFTGQNVSIKFNVPGDSVVFSHKNKESVIEFLNKAFDLHWEAEELIKSNSVIDEVSAHLGTTIVYFKETFKEALDNLKID